MSDDEPVFRPEKEDLLLAIDAAIGNLMTLRGYVNMAVAGPDVPMHDPRKAGPTKPKWKHDGHMIDAGGFGAPRFCLDCDEDVEEERGVSAPDDDELEP